MTSERDASAIEELLRKWSVELFQERPDPAQQRNGKVSKAESWDIATLQEKMKITLEASMEADPVINAITIRLEKFRKPGFVKENTARVLEATFSAITWLGPGMGIPAAAEFSRILTVKCTGGSEEDKMVKELYLDKSLQSRIAAISEETQMTLTCFQLGTMQKNKILAATSRAIVSELVRTAAVSQKQ
jgi:hypothetical protein